MKKKYFLFLLVLCVNACKDNTEPNGLTEEAATAVSEQDTDITYAEISVKEGGEWGERKYIGGEFVNVSELEVPENHTDHTDFIRYEGPGWENEHVAYRLYLDWRNAIDIFGKRGDTLVLPYVGQDGFDSYHSNAAWGMDILKAGTSMGIGGFGRYVADSVAHFRTVGQTTARVNNAEDYSTVELVYSDWKTGDEIIDLEAELTIFPNDLHTRAVLTPSDRISGLTTGIVKFEDVPLMKKEPADSEWGYIATYGTQTLVNDSDKLGMALFYKPEQVEEVKEGEDDHLVIFKPTVEDVTYYFLGAWEQQQNGIKNKDEFEVYLEDVLESLNEQ